MQRPIVLFTDFGASGPYVGQVKAALLAEAPRAPVIDLVADAPAFDPRLSAYLLAALAPEMPAGAVMLCVVDPGVGGDRAPMVASIDGRWYVGPDNGLFELVGRRATRAEAWRIDWRPARLSATFHGRDLFSPVAGRLAHGLAPAAIGCRSMAWPARADWPDDLAAIIYVDHYGNALTGLRAREVPPEATIAAGGRTLAHARTYGDRRPGEAFWYENSIGLIEIAVSGGRANDALEIGVGMPVSLNW